jgi:hypothetical protein
VNDVLCGFNDCRPQVGRRGVSGTTFGGDGGAGRVTGTVVVVTNVVTVGAVVVTVGAVIVRAARLIGGITRWVGVVGETTKLSTRGRGTVVVVEYGKVVGDGVC